MFKGLRHMTPGRPIDNSFCLTLSYAEHGANLSQRESGSHAFLSYSDNIGLCKFRASIRLAFGVSAVTDLIGFVFSRRRPTQIFRSIVEAISVPMSGVLAFRWPFSVERRAYKSVDCHAGLAANRHPVISSPKGWALHGAKPKPSMPIGFRNPSVYRPHTPKTGCLIPRIAGYCAPLLRFIIGPVCHLLPRNPLPNERDRLAGDVELLGYRRDLTSVIAGRQQFADFSDAFLSKSGVVVSDTVDKRAVAHAFGAIFQRCHPPKVARTIVGAIAVLVGNLMPVCRARTMEREAHKHVKEGSKIAQINLMVSVNQVWTQNPPREEASSSVLICYETIQRPDASKARRRVVRVARHLTPSLSFGMRSRSHCSFSTSKMVRGWRRGERLSSVPHCNNRAHHLQGSITILCART